MTEILAGALLAMAVLVLAPGSDRLRLPVPPRRRRLPARRRLVRARPLDPGLVVTEVATRLRAGADPEAAFGAALARAGTAPRPGRPAPPSAPEPGVPAALLSLAAHQPGLTGAVAACRLTQHLGAPLAEVLDRCAHGLAEAERARTDRAVAVAGPRTTARLLQGLPLLGLALGALVGADPLAVLTDGGLGTLALAAGLLLTVAGHRWTRRLVHAAESGAGP